MRGAKIILGVTGGIAAYKSVYLLRLLKKAGADIRVVCTPHVKHFVGELTFASLSEHPVFEGLWSESWSQHVELGQWADLMVVAPCTANTLAKLAHGLCDNALTAVYLAAKCPVLIAPAMDVDMYAHPATQHNLQLLQSYGNTVLPTDEGFLASGLHGAGRMLEPEAIFNYIEYALAPKPLVGKNILISAGPTQEAIDPVRYISNHSTGKMGYALARQAQVWGAHVTLVTGPSAQAIPAGVAAISVVSAADMLSAIQANLSAADVLIMAAAVADYTPITVAQHKIKKQGDMMDIALHKTADILKTLAPHKLPHQQWIGFALETQDELKHAQEKLLRKNLDCIVLNSLQDAGAGFAHDTNKITILRKDGTQQSFPLKSKTAVAEDILREIR